MNGEHWGNIWYSWRIFSLKGVDPCSLYQMLLNATCFWHEIFVL